MPTKQRENTLETFKTGQWQWKFLVCDYTLARGFDYHHVRFVIHYDMPPDANTYLHCRGRAGR